MRRVVGVVALLGVAMSTSVAAAQPRTDDAASETANPGVTAAQREEARVRFARGTQLYDEG